MLVVCTRDVEPRLLRNKDTFDNNDFVLEDVKDNLGDMEG